ncbi:unnamed protein product [Didymodactylos carnosus]|uniref:Uncharacterized protein n=1 Tax=Didymodactylos carnosus TaxID=1234261 RepID=A0A814HZE8_9BILA|nr:unnamed protein product [Didymodactylos carnosus]CAF3788219.1 unnamed protein product [Didymodactylos carnosus]
MLAATTSTRRLKFFSAVENLISYYLPINVRYSYILTKALVNSVMKATEQTRSSYKQYKNLWWKAQRVCKPFRSFKLLGCCLCSMFLCIICCRTIKQCVCCSCSSEEEFIYVPEWDADDDTFDQAVRTLSATTNYEPTFNEYPIHLTEEENLTTNDMQMFTITPDMYLTSYILKNAFYAVISDYLIEQKKKRKKHHSDFLFDLNHSHTDAAIIPTDCNDCLLLIINVTIHILEVVAVYALKGSIPSYFVPKLDLMRFYTNYQAESGLILAGEDNETNMKIKSKAPELYRVVLFMKAMIEVGEGL